MYLYRPYKQFSTTKILPLQMVPISGLAQGLQAPTFQTVQQYWNYEGFIQLHFSLTGNAR